MSGKPEGKPEMASAAQPDPPRLRQAPGLLGRALDRAAREAEAARPIARARVWRALANEAPSRSVFAWIPRGAKIAVGLACAAALVALVVNARSPSSRKAQQTDLEADAVQASGTVRGSWQLAELSGDVRLESAGHSAAAAAGANLPLHARVRVGAGSAAVLAQDGVRIALAPGSVIQLDEFAKLEEGSAAISLPIDAAAPAQPSSQISLTGQDPLTGPSLLTSRFHMAAGSSLVDASGGIFLASVHAERAQFQSASAALRVHNDGGEVRIAAGNSWSARGASAIDADSSHALIELAGSAPAPSALRKVALLQPASAQRDRGEVLQALAREAEREQRYAQAASGFEELAALGGTRASTALYELARLRLRFLDQPAAALAALDEERARFPQSPIAQEVALTAVEARLALREDVATLREMNSFLEQFAESERASEVRWLRASLELRQGPCSAARSDLDALVPDAKFGGDALFALAACARRAGDSRGERARLDEYLRRFPQGPHRHQAQIALHDAASGEP